MHYSFNGQIHIADLEDVCDSCPVVIMASTDAELAVSLVHCVYDAFNHLGDVLRWPAWRTNLYLVKVYLTGTLSGANSGREIVRDVSIHCQGWAGSSRKTICREFTEKLVALDKELNSELAKRLT